eukprot:scpid67944/ scgid9188/ Calpain-D; Calcium-activated neutral proteinase D; Small optic lobes protein
MQSALHEMAQTQTTATQCESAIAGVMAPQGFDSNSNDLDYSHNGDALRSSQYPGRYNIYSYTGVSNVSWGRLTDLVNSSTFYEKYIGKTPSMFGDAVNVSDIVQGALGDCYFLAAVAALAEDKERMKDVFKTKDLAKEMALNLYIRGKYVQVNIDDWVPMRDWSYGTKKLVYGQAGPDASVYLSILEKAWAKISNNYELIIGGSQTEVFKVFTGAPMTEERTADFSAADLWTLIKSSDGKNLIMGAGTPAPPNPVAGQNVDQNQMSNGVHYNHAYTLIGCVEVGS